MVVVLRCLICFCKYLGLTTSIRAVFFAFCLHFISLLLLFWWLKLICRKINFKFGSCTVHDEVFNTHFKLGSSSGVFICDAAHQKKKKKGGPLWLWTFLESPQLNENIQKIMKKTIRIFNPFSVVKYECLD